VSLQGRKVMQMFVGPRQAGSDAAQRSSGEGAIPAVTSLPGPLEQVVGVNVSGGELVAVLQFEGYITPAAAEDARRRLMAYLERGGLRRGQAGEASLAYHTCHDPGTARAGP
jgi:hypothetical protein